MQKVSQLWILVCLAALQLWACDSSQNEEKKLPYLGRKVIKEVEVNGKMQMDTSNHRIASFSFVNQDGERVDNATVEGKIYVADFFFTSCPSICPTMKSQMLKIYETFKDNQDVLLLSHSIDPEYDTVELLRDYAEKLGVSSQTWHFLTGDKETIYDIGQTSYMISAMEDEEAPGGFLHSGAFLLIDREGHIRGVYDGTEEMEVKVLIKDIKRLLKEEKKSGDKIS